jgi:hypothetical protein
VSASPSGSQHAARTPSPLCAAGRRQLRYKDGPQAASAAVPVINERVRDGRKCNAHDFGCNAATEPLCVKRPNSARPASPVAASHPVLARPKSAMVVSAQPPRCPDSPRCALPVAAATPPSRKRHNSPAEASSVAPEYEEGAQPRRTATKHAQQMFRYHVQPQSELQARPRFTRARGAVDTHMPQATLHATVVDQLNGAPVAGAAVSVVELQAFLRGSTANCGSTQRRTSKADSRGRIKCTILGLYRCASALWHA